MAGFCFDLARLCAYEAKRGVNDIQLLQMPGTLIFTQREKLAQAPVDVDFHAARSLSGPCVFGEDHAQTGTPEWHPLSPTHGISCRFHPPQA